MKMEAVLTLQIPQGSKFIPIAMTADRKVLIAFKQSVLTDWENRCLTAKDQIEARCQQAELNKLRTVLNLLIPDSGVNHEQ